MPEKKGLVDDKGDRLHIHPTSGHPEGAPEIHLVYRSGEKTWNYEPEERTTSTVWRSWYCWCIIEPQSNSPLDSDVSYERQPPGLTTFFLLDAREFTAYPFPNIKNLT